MTTKTLKAACYLRVSTDHQTTTNQRAAVEELARARGYEPVWFVEQESAGRRRPIYESMMDDVRRGRLRAVVVLALDRAHRSMLQCSNWVAECDRLKVAILSVREPWLDMDPSSPTRPLLVSVISWAAEMERRVMKERTCAGVARKRAEQGGAWGRRPTSSVALADAADRVLRFGYSVPNAAKAAGVSRSVLYRHLSMLRDERIAALAPAEREANPAPEDSR